MRKKIGLLTGLTAGLVLATIRYWIYVEFGIDAVLEVDIWFITGMLIGSSIAVYFYWRKRQRDFQRGTEFIENLEGEKINEEPKWHSIHEAGFLALKSADYEKLHIEYMNAENNFILKIQPDSRKKLWEQLLKDMEIGYTINTNTIPEEYTFKSRRDFGKVLKARKEFEFFYNRMEGKEKEWM